VHLLGNALAAYPASRLMGRVGRRPGLVLGYVFGLTGALAAGTAVVAGSWPGFLAGFALMGMMRGFTDLGRYAAAEMHPVDYRGRAISLVVLGGTLGAIGGPALVGPAGRLAASLGHDVLAGPWFASAALFSLGLLFTAVFLRPDPAVIAAAVAARQGLPGEAPPALAAGPARALRPLRHLLALPAIQAAATAMIAGQLVMVMLMSVTSLHMQSHGHALDGISLVMMAHTLGMFGLSVVTGRLADRWGRARVILAGAGLLAAACLVAPQTTSAAGLSLAMFLLGLGWNFCAVAGAALLTDSLSLAERSRLQGANDLTVSLVSAVGSLQSAALLAGLGYGGLALISLGLCALPAWLAIRVRLSAPPVAGLAPGPVETL
jgi:MFS family permease